MGDKGSSQGPTPSEQKSPAAQPRRRVLSRFFGLFSRRSNSDFEKKLQHLSQEERAVHERLKRRARTWAKLARGLLVYSIVIEILLLGFAIWTTRSPDLPWKRRGMRVLPSFALPVLVSLVYSGLARYYRMRERKDQNTLERLKAERQAKIDELKEKTNYYALQQLIQQYDSDPAAKAAAATILAAKIGVESGLKLAFQPHEVEAQRNGNQSPRVGKSHEAGSADPSGLRRRRGPRLDQAEPASQLALPDRYAGSYPHEASYDEGSSNSFLDDGEMQLNKERGSGGGWMARFAAMLVGEDPSQCYALICKNCFMHNGLAKKEDFPYITYYCPHCHALNGRRPTKDVTPEAGGMGDGPSVSPRETSLRPTQSLQSATPTSPSALSRALKEAASTLDSQAGSLAEDEDDQD